MISRYFDEGPWKGLTSLELALSPGNLNSLRTVAAQDNDWKPGRQEGGEYFTLNLMDGYYGGEFTEIRSRLLHAIAKHVGIKPVKLQNANDFWLIYYPTGSCGVPSHKDPAPFGAKHVRANVCVTAPESGGELVLPNGFYVQTVLPVALGVGEGIIFSPSEVEHSVARVGRGGRLIVSVGAVIST